MKKINNILIIMMLIFSSFLIINNIKDNSVKAITGNGTLGHTTAWTLPYNVSYGKTLMIRERECSEVVNCPYKARINCIWAYLRYSYAPQTVTCGFYDNLGTYVYKTEEKNISSSTFKWYQFNFTRLVPTIDNHNYMIVVYGNCPTSPGLTTRIYIQIGGTNIGIYRYMHEENNYPTFDNAPSWTSQSGFDFSLYCEYDIYPHNSTDIIVYSNPVNCSGTTKTQYNNVIGWKVWSNYTSSLLKYENIGYASGTHESRWDTTTSRFIVWANYSSKIKKYENIKNATGTHESKWDVPAGSWIVWANYTGNSTVCNVTDIHLLQNIINATGTHIYLLNSTGYYVFANYTGIGTGGCSGIVWVNYTDSNLTFNVSVDKSTNANTSSYNIKDTNWLYLGSMLVLDNAQFFIVILIALWSFFISRYFDNKSMMIGLCIFALSIPLSIVLAIISLTYPFGFIIVFLIPILSLYLLVDSIYYSENKKKKK